MGFMGWLGNCDGKFVFIVLMIVFDMYVEVINGLVVDIKIDVDSFVLCFIGVIDVVKCVLYFDVIFVEKDGKLIVMVVNKYFFLLVIMILNVCSRISYGVYDMMVMIVDFLDVNIGM